MLRAYQIGLPAKMNGNASMLYYKSLILRDFPGDTYLEGGSIE